MQTTWSLSVSHLQVALDAVHAWGVHWRFSFGIGPTKSATMVFGCCVHLGGVPLLLVQQYKYLGVVLSPTFSCRPSRRFCLLSRGSSLTRPVFGVLVKVSLSRFPHLFSSPMFSRAHPLVLSSLVMILVPSSSSTSHSVAGVATFSDAPVATGHWELGIGDALLLAHGRTFSLFGRVCAVDHASPRPPVTAKCVPALFFCKVRGRIGAYLLFTLSPSCRYFSLLPAPVVLPRSQSRVDRALRHKLSATVSDLHGVLVDVSSQSGRSPSTPLTFLLPFVFKVLPTGAMSTPPQAAAGPFHLPVLP